MVLPDGYSQCCSVGAFMMYWIPFQSILLHFCCIDYIELLEIYCCWWKFHWRDGWSRWCLLSILLLLWCGNCWLFSDHSDGDAFVLRLFCDVPCTDIRLTITPHTLRYAFFITILRAHYWRYLTSIWHYDCLFWWLFVGTIPLPDVRVYSRCHSLHSVLRLFDSIWRCLGICSTVRWRGDTTVEGTPVRCLVWRCVPVTCCYYYFVLLVTLFILILLLGIVLIPILLFTRYSCSVLTTVPRYGDTFGGCGTFQWKLPIWWCLHFFMTTILCSFWCSWKLFVADRWWCVFISAVIHCSSVPLPAVIHYLILIPVDLVMMHWSTGITCIYCIHWPVEVMFCILTCYSTIVFDGKQYYWLFSPASYYGVTILEKWLMAGSQPVMLAVANGVANLTSYVTGVLVPTPACIRLAISAAGSWSRAFMVLWHCMMVMFYVGDGRVFIVWYIVWYYSVVIDRAWYSYDTWAYSIDEAALAYSIRPSIADYCGICATYCLVINAMTMCICGS